MSSIEEIPNEILVIQRGFDFVGGVSLGQKLYFKKLYYVGKWDLYKRFVRFMDKEDRNYTLENLRIMFRTYIIIKLNNQAKYNQLLDDSFVRFYKGVEVLCETYKEDKFFVFYKSLQEWNNL